MINKIFQYKFKNNYHFNKLMIKIKEFLDIFLLIIRIPVQKNINLRKT